MSEYTYINLSSPILTLNVIIWGLYVGLVIACIYATYRRNLQADIVSSLFGYGADSPESSRTLPSLGMKGKRLKAALKILASGSVISRSVLCANRADFITENDKKSLSYKLARIFSVASETNERLGETALFYIPEENRVTADVRHKKRKCSPWLVVAFAVGLCGVMIFISFAIPKLLGMLDDTIGYLSSI